MTEDIKVTKEFTETALFDLDFVKGKQYKLNEEKETAAKFEKYAQVDGARAKETEKESKDYETRTAPIERVSRSLARVEDMASGKYGPEYGNISASATKYLDNLFKNGLSDKEAAEIRSGKAPQVDIDGSKKSLFGRLKNKVKNVWKPYNPKQSMEDDIAKLKIAMANDPALMSDVKYRTSSTVHHFATNFKELAEKRDIFSKDLLSTKLYFSGNHAFETSVASQATEKAQAHEATLEAVDKVREAAANKIEVTKTARENVGITDANANTGVDKLAEKAEKMKNMTPAQRLAMRLGDMRGTKQEAPKPVQKQELSGNIMAQNLANNKSNS